LLTISEVNIKLALTRIKIHRSQFEPQRQKSYEDIARDLKEKKHQELVRVKVEKLILDRYLADATVQVEFLLESLLGSIKVIAQRYELTCFVQRLMHSSPQNIPNDIITIMAGIVYASQKVKVKDLLVITNEIQMKCGTQFVHSCHKGKQVDPNVWLSFNYYFLLIS
jgi:hypothetical protein